MNRDTYWLLYIEKTGGGFGETRWVTTVAVPALRERIVA